ncbi:MAG: DUF5666 domain-containing protein [Steroidobacteraceae bacterium]
MIVTKLARYLSTGIVALFVAACGGGGGGSGDGGVASAGSGSSSATTPSTPSTPATGNTPRPTSGIEGTGRHVASIGTITAFGSIFVNGIEYSTDRASIEVDGRAVAQSDLRLGQVVTVVGTLNTDGKTAVADQVSFSAPLVGAIDSIDARNAQLVILGQRVQVDGATKFAADVGGDSIAALSVGMELQVSGFRDSRGVLSARSIERRRAGQAYVATGDAVAVDAAAQRLTIGALQVSYRSATLAGFNGRAPAGGDYVRAEALVPAGRRRARGDPPRARGSAPAGADRQHRPPAGLGHALRLRDRLRRRAALRSPPTRARSTTPRSWPASAACGSIASSTWSACCSPTGACSRPTSSPTTW